MANNVVRTIILLTGGGTTFCAWETWRGNPKFYSNILMPTLRTFVSAETAHKLAVKFMKYAPKTNYVDPGCLHTKVWNMEFSNPIGIAAGFDKHAEAMKGLVNTGFGFVEIGSVTPLPQDGNPQPRVFRLPEDNAVINRYGFNSCGHDVVAERLRKWRNSDQTTILGVNLGKNKTSDDHIRDYVTGVVKLGNFADYIVINVSSPNTPGLRKLQGEEFLREMLFEIKRERNLLKRNPKPVLLVKIAPDLSDKDISDISKIVTCKESGVDGLIITNTTIRRPDSLQSENKRETGGLSGEPLKDISTDIVRKMYACTNGQIPIIGVGGVTTGADAYEKICAGASLVQFYTALVFHGFPVLKKMKAELAELLEKDGFETVTEAVGSDHRRYTTPTL